MTESLVKENTKSIAGGRSATLSPRVRTVKPKPLVPKWFKKAASEFAKDVAYGSNRKKR
jgi:hypothetical protein